MKILVVYDANQTFTNTVYEHLQAFARFSAHQVRYIDFRMLTEPDVNLSTYDVLVHHYSVRLTVAQMSLEAIDLEADFCGRKILFIQDEYDYVDQTVRVINYIGYDWVFTCVPSHGVPYVYRNVDTRRTGFSQVLTGYAPLDPPAKDDIPPPSTRSITVGYRGRRLPVQYGELGRMKYEFAEVVEAECERLSLSCDIETIDAKRLYGQHWEEFLRRNSVSLGTPSGSNVFDFDGTLPSRVEDAYRWGQSEEYVYTSLVAPKERPGLMNQISARTFEAVCYGNALLMVRDDYSGVIHAETHYIPVSPDYSDVASAVERLCDLKALDRLWSTAYADLIESGQWSYGVMIDKFDRVLDDLPASAEPMAITEGLLTPPATESPQRAEFAAPPPRTMRSSLEGILIAARHDQLSSHRSGRFLQQCARRLPSRRALKRVLGKFATGSKGTDT